MKVSLILCTLNRVSEVEDFLNSLVVQSYQNFEVIIVDQNLDNRIDRVIDKYSQKFSIKYIKSEIGLSKSRNQGLLYAKGDIVGFPDDDCIYPKELLQNIVKFFQSNVYNFVLGKTIDKDSKKIVAGSNEYKEKELNCHKMYGSSTTFFISLKSTPIELVKFDELFGLGAKYKSEEENDLVFRLIQKGYKGKYIPDLNYVYHPLSDLDYANIDRVKERTIGLGALIAKHFFTKCGFGYFIKYNFIRPLSGSILYLFKGDVKRSKFYFYRFVGIWKGFIQYSLGKICN